jgi:hypothetical protein
MTYKYTIDDALTIRIFNGEETIPFWLQPDYPNGDKFDTKSEAEAWAEYAVASMDGTSPLPPVGKGLQPEVRVPSVPPIYSN